MNMRELKKRRVAVIKVFCDLSRDGWRNAKSYDYTNLELELDELSKQMMLAKWRAEWRDAVDQ